MGAPALMLKKTTELTASEKNQILRLFFEVFGKEKSAAHFDSEFSVTALGYSYHGLMVSGDTIVGCYSSIPYRYSFFGTECLFALSVDTMIKREFRGLHDLSAMANLVYDRMRRDGIEFVFGFPNDNIYQIRKRFLGWRDIGTLDFFVLPVKASTLFGLGNYVDFLSKTFGYLVNSVGSIAAFGSWPHFYAIHRVDDDLFKLHRYSFFDRDYRTEDVGGGRSVTYRVELHNGIRVAYIVDLTSLSPRHFFQAVRRVFIRCHSEVDVILYVGKLPFLSCNIFRVPKRFEPKTEYMSGKILAGSVVDERAYDISNWRVNLSSFDVV